jgi:hypothetical protein
MGGRFNTAGFPVSDEERLAIAARQIAVREYLATCPDHPLPTVPVPRPSLVDRLFAPRRAISRHPENRTDPADSWFWRLGRLLWSLRFPPAIAESRHDRPVHDRPAVCRPVLGR